jgi:putative sterol carrier protein
MGQTSAEFFDRLAERGHDPLLEKATGAIRFDVKDDGKTQRWRVAIDKGDIDVSRSNAAADCVVTTDPVTLQRVLSGNVNPFAAVLRGTVAIEGDSELIVLFQRVFRGQP